MEERKKHTSLQEIVIEKQERKDQLGFQLLLKEWSENEQTIRALSQQIAKLEQNSGLEQVNQRMDEIKQEAREQWEQSYLSIKEAVRQYLGYQKFLKKKGTELSMQDKQKTKAIAKLSTEIDFLYTQMHTFESKEAALIQEFGDRLTYDLKGYTLMLSKQIEEKRAKLEELQTKEKNLESCKMNLPLHRGRLPNRLSFQKKNVRN